jgi:hypothetical protein
MAKNVSFKAVHRCIGNTVDDCAYDLRDGRYVPDVWAAENCVLAVGFFLGGYIPGRDFTSE